MCVIRWTNVSDGVCSYVCPVLTGVEWFGVDIGGTLTKGVYFECHTQSDKNKGEGVRVLQNFVKSNLTYGSSGNRDAHLEMHNQKFGSKVGTMHFIKFATDRMEGFMKMVTENGLANFSKVVGATGGGAYKFEEDFKKKLGIRLRKYDELLCLTKGIQYACTHYPNECFYWANLNPSGFGATKKHFDFDHEIYPYIITNIGSGVSILLVKSENEIQRVGGTSIGGGTFQGLCAMLIGTDSFDEAIEMAEKGDATKVDKLVRDIYGGSYDKFGLGGEIVASSFGNMIHPEKRANVKPEDLAKATLVTVTNTVSAMARMCAAAAGVDNVVFVGNYLRNNNMSMQMLAYAMEYWSGGTGRALFMEHEGYFCALGALLLCQDME
jgi:type II pantothenate kinase